MNDSNGNVHGGNIDEISRVYGLKKIIDFSSNVNPFAMPRGLKKAVGSMVHKIPAYPDAESHELKTAIGKHLGIGTGNIVVGNGSADLIYRAVNVLRPGTGIVLSPTFAEYEKSLLSAGAKVVRILLKESSNFNISAEEIMGQAVKGGVVFLCNPNNPTGALVPAKTLKLLIKELQRTETMLILDEAFIDVAEEHSLTAFAAGNSGLLVLRSMTKFFGLAGLRLGYAVGNRKLIKRIQDFGQPWPVNIFAQAAGKEAIRDEKFRDRSKRMLLREMDFLHRRLCLVRGLKPFRPSANFIMAKIEGPLSSLGLKNLLIKRGMLIRDCSNFHGLNSKYFRVAVRSRKENLRLLMELETIFNNKGINNE
jgi:threonine-phosphate decarboxylase